MSLTATPDRKSPPQFRTVDEINLQRVAEHRLSNGIPLYYVNAGTQDVIRIEFVFPAGAVNESKRLVASSTGSLLSDGTTSHTAEQIAERIDYYGAYFQTETSGDFAFVQLYTLNKYLDQTLPVIKEIITGSSFPKRELEIFIQNRKQKLAVNNEEVDYVARKKFAELIFGSDHPYGYYATEKDYSNLNTEELLRFRKQHYHSGDCRIIVSGKVSDLSLKAIDKHFGGNDWSSNENCPVSGKSTVQSSSVKKHLVEKKDAVQSSIRMGRLLFTKNHPDFIPLLVLNTIFGGYFGSRLMSNIREDKGFTYGIGSALHSHLHEGFFFISTEVGVEVTSKALHEIYFELKRLRTEPVGKDELQLVTNYMLGVFLRSIDGPFAIADKFKSILLSGLDYGYYEKYIRTIKTITPENLMELAGKYLREDQITELVVGKM